MTSLIESGVSYYTKATAKVPVYFPENHVACQYCRLFCRYEDAFQRYSCRLTDEWLLDVKHGVGENCPLEFSENSDIPF